MENISTRTWTAIGVVGLLLFLASAARWGVQREAWAPTSASFSYEMPRPQNYEPGFDLSDREVERDFTKLPGLPAMKKATEKAKAKVDPKKAEADKKAVAAKKAAEAKARAAALAAAKRRLQVKTVNTARASTLTANFIPGSNSQTGMYGDSGIAGTDTTANPADNKKEDEDEQLTASQWRSLLQSSPSAENIAKFIKAKHEGKIDSTTYYQIVHELLVDSASDRRRAALAILDQDISAKTFEFLVTSLASAPSDAKAQIQKALASYAQPSKMALLIRVLSSSKDAAVLQTAATQLSTAFSDFKKVYTSSENQNRRLAGGFSLQQFLAMVSPLKRLAEGGSSPVASQMSQLVSEIEALKATAGPSQASRLAMPGTDID